MIGFNELAVAGLLRAASLADVAIPTDLTVVALSLADVAAEMLTPPLTTVSPSASKLATIAVDALVDLIEGRAALETPALVTPVLTVRGSSGPVPRTRV